MPKKVKYWAAAQVECEAMSNWIQKEKTDASERHGSGTAYLAILERRGVLDGVLAILLAAQAWAMWRFPASNPATPLGWVAGTSLVIWFVVVLGAIAPLTRRGATRPGELPRAAPLWLIAYGLMALAWVIVLVNANADSLFGFWHLHRLDPFEAGVAVTLIPLAMAPGWRRMGRAGCLAWLRRRRARGDRLPGGLQLEARRGIFKRSLIKRTLIPLAFLSAYAWLMCDYAILSDGWGLIGMTGNRSPLEPNGYREPGSLLLLREVHHLLNNVGVNPRQSIAFVNFMAMLGVLACFTWLMRPWRFTSVQRHAGWWLILSSLGITQMLLGRVEVYALLMLGLVATLTLGIAALDGRCCLGWMAVVYALTLAGHLSAIFILPAVLALIGFWSRRQPRPSRAFMRGMAHLLGWGALIHLPLWGWLMVQLDPSTPGALVDAVLGALNTGGENETFIGTTQSTFRAQLAELFSFENLLKMLQLHFLLCGGVLLVGCLAPLARRFGGWQAGARPTREGRATLWVLAIAWLGYAFYAWSWRADWPWWQDWDLFSALAPLAALVAVFWLMPARAVHRLPPALVSRVCLFALLLSMTQHYYNHVYVGTLTSWNKSQQSKRHGRILQWHQLENRWERGTLYRVEDGKLIVTPPLGDAAQSP